MGMSDDEIERQIYIIEQAEELHEAIDRLEQD
jgi:hypothetical protein